MVKSKILRLTAIALILTLICACLTACKDGGDDPASASSGRTVTIEVNTMYAGDEYGDIFFNAVAEWESGTG